jgi:hypothetical protein
MMLRLRFCFAALTCAALAGGCGRGPSGFSTIPYAGNAPAAKTWGTGFTEYATVTAGSVSKGTQAGHGLVFGKKTSPYNGHYRVAYQGTYALWTTNLVAALGGTAIRNAVSVLNDKKKNLYPGASNQSIADVQDQIRFVSSSLPKGKGILFKMILSVKPEITAIHCAATNQNSSTVSATSTLSGTTGVSVSGGCSGAKFTWLIHGGTTIGLTSVSTVVQSEVGQVLPLAVNSTVTTAPTTNGRSGKTSYAIGITSCVAFKVLTKGVGVKADSGHNYGNCSFK